MTTNKADIEQELNATPKASKNTAKLDTAKQDLFEVQQYFKDVKTIEDKTDRKEAGRAVQRFIAYLAIPGIPDSLAKDIASTRDDLVKALGEEGSNPAPKAKSSGDKPKRTLSAPMRGIGIEVNQDLCAKYRLEASTFVSRKALAMAVMSGLGKTDLKPAKYTTWDETFSHEGPAVFLHNNAPEIYALCPMPSLPVPEIGAEPKVKAPKAVKPKVEKKTAQNSPSNPQKSEGSEPSAAQTPTPGENVASEQNSPVESGSVPEPKAAEPKKGSKQAHQKAAVVGMTGEPKAPKKSAAEKRAEASGKVEATVDGKQIHVTPMNSAAAPTEPNGTEPKAKAKQVSRKR